MPQLARPLLTILFDVALPLADIAFDLFPYSISSPSLRTKYLCGIQLSRQFTYEFITLEAARRWTWLRDAIVCLSITALQAAQLPQDVNNIFPVGSPASPPASNLASLPEALLEAPSICT
jgi:hypothetical protein